MIGSAVTVAFFVLFFLMLGTALKMQPLSSKRISRNCRRNLAEVHPDAKLYNPLIPYSDQLVPLAPTPSDYIYTPPEVGPEIYVGSVVAVLPIAWGAVEFYKRIKTQQACLLCTGSGLVYTTPSGNKLTKPRKCWSCGGFIPWLGWKMFFFSTFFDVGNGGVLQRPSSNYDEINEKIKRGEIVPGFTEDDAKDPFDKE